MIAQSDEQTNKKKKSSKKQEEKNKYQSFANLKQIYSNAEDLYEALTHDKKMFKSVETQHPTNKQYTIIDFSLNARGMKQDQIYLRQSFYRNNIRRGNTLLYNTKNKTIQIARKGLKKFFDLTKPLLQAIKQENTTKLSQKKDKPTYQCIFKEIQNVLEYNKQLSQTDKAQIEVYKLNKANGQNVQISFNKELGQWVVSSKNVSTFLKTENDIALYKQTRYNFATQIASSWFNIIKKLDKGKISNLKDELSKKTMIGEYCGHPDHQHLVKYKQITIYFYAIVQFNSPYCCIPPKQALTFFEKYQLPVVNNYSKSYIGSFTCFQTLSTQLLQIFKQISKSSILQQEQGSVIYFVIKQTKKYCQFILQNNLQQTIPVPENQQKFETVEHVSSLGKIKTIQYRILRKLRQKLKHFLSLPQLQQNATKLQQKYALFEKESYQLLMGQNLPKPIQYYFCTALLAFQYVLKHVKINKAISIVKQYYLDFINIIFWCLENKKPITEQIVYDEEFVEKLRNYSWESYSSQVSNQYPLLLEKILPRYAKIKKTTQILGKTEEIEGEQVHQDIQ